VAIEVAGRFLVDHANADFAQLVYNSALRGAESTCTLHCYEARSPSFLAAVSP
jgi:hypothetical protein